MKLDSIVYDIPTLANALTEQLVLDSPTFQALYPSETATSLVNVMAGYGSMLQYMIVSAMANCYTDSAFSPSGIYQLAETLGNRLHGKIAASVTCTIQRDTCRGRSCTIPANSIFTVEEKPFFNPYSISFSSGVDSVKDVILVQGTQVVVEKTTSGKEDEKIYFGSDFSVDPNYIWVYVNGVEWATTDSFISYDINSVLNESELQVVVFRTDADGRSYIKFGNGVNGLLPPEGSTVKIVFTSNEGSQGNILKNNLEVSLVTPIYYDQEQLLISASSTSTSYGGSDQQSLITLKESSPYVFASGDRCVRRNDYKAVLLNKCGYLTCNVWGEFEEAQAKGTYDKSMMNLVYYTGLKSFRRIEPYEIGVFNYDEILPTQDMYVWTGSLGNSRALPGSVNITIENELEPDSKIVYTDVGGRGILFNNDDIQFSTDDLLNDYLDGLVDLQVINGGENGYNTIENIVYNLPNSTINSFYESTASCNRTNPIQIAFNYLTPETSRAIAGIKFYIPNGDTRYTQDSIGAFAVYGTNEQLPSYNNVVNNSDWVEVIPFTQLIPANPGEWGSWIASNLFMTGEGAHIISKSNTPGENGITYYRDPAKDVVSSSSYAWTTKDGTKTVFTSVVIPVGYNEATQEDGSPIYETSSLSVELGSVQSYDNWPLFSRYVLEIYSLQNKSTDTLKLGKVKLLYAESERQGIKTTEVSTIDYDNNGAIELRVEEASSIFNDFYNYTITPTGINSNAGYRTGDKLQASFTTNYYTYSTPAITNSGHDYIAGDIVTVSDGVNTLHYKINRVSNDGDARGLVLDGEWLEPYGSAIINSPEDGFTTELYSRPAAVLTVVTDPQNAKVVLDSRCYVGAGVPGSQAVTYYYRSSSLDKNNIGGINYLAWTTNNTATAVTLYSAQEETISIEQTAGSNLSGLNVIEETFSNAVYGVPGVYNFTYNGTSWTYNDEEVQLSTYGISYITGIPVANNVITVTYNDALVSLNVPLFSYDDEQDLMVDSGLVVKYYRGPLKTPNGLKLTVTSTPIIYTVYVDVLGSKDMDSDGNNFSLDVSMDVDSDEDLYQDFLGRFSVVEESQDLEPIEGSTSSGLGASVEVTSTPSLKVKASLYGNKVSETEVARIDSVILEKYNHFTTYLEFVQPNIVQTTIRARINYKEAINITAVKQNITNAVNNLFEITPNYMGSPLLLSDLYKAIRDVEGVNYVLIDYPTTNVEVDKNQVLLLSNLELIDEI